MKIDINYRHRDDEPSRIVQRLLAWEPYGIPSKGDLDVNRWAGAPTWLPSGTRPLTRHCAPDGTRIVTAQRTSPRGFEIEFDLGVVHVHAQPGTTRLLSTPEGYVTTVIEGATADGSTELGHVELAALPLLTSLEERRLPDGQITLVAGPWDPLYGESEWLRTLGFVDGFPIEPRQPRIHCVDVTTAKLWRVQDGAARRHRYVVGDDPGELAVSLGGVLTQPHEGYLPLTAAHGMVRTDALTAKPSRRHPTAFLRWAAAPLGWSGRRLPTWAVRAALGRARELPKLVRSTGDRVALDLGYVATDHVTGTVPLYAATHHVTQDVFLTLAPLEATDMGYDLSGVVGHVVARHIDPSRTGVQQEVKWASRFGQRRRYVRPEDIA